MSNDYVIHKVDLVKNRDVFLYLGKKQHDEVEKYFTGVDLSGKNADWEQLLTLTQQGIMHSYVCATPEGWPCGYIVVFKTKHPMLGYVMVQEMLMYVDPDHRGKGLAGRMMSTVEKEFEGQVDMFMFSIKPNPSAMSSMEKQGFVLYEHVFMKKGK